MSQHCSVWRATAAQPDYPPLSGDAQTDVCVVGGGITGVTAALLLRRAGAAVTLVEAGCIGGGTTGGTTGKVTSQHGLTYASLLDRHGDAVAQAYADANQAAIGAVARLARECGVPDAVGFAPAYVYTSDPAQRDAFEREHEAAHRLGLPSSLTTMIELPVPCELALRFERQAHVHPVRYLDALTAHFVAIGGVVAQATRATAVDEWSSPAFPDTYRSRLRPREGVRDAWSAPAGVPASCC